MSQPLPIVRPTDVNQPPVFSRVAIIGLGLIGGSLALAIKRWQTATMVIAVDRKEVIERATIVQAIDVGADDLGMASDAELIVLAAPVDENVRILDGLPDLISGNALITDVGSTKRVIANAASRLPKRLTFIGGHPMAGAAVGGFEYARADLFSGRPWVIDSGADADPSRLVAFLNALGARCVPMPADQHDRMMAFLSALPQLTVSALMEVVGEAVGSEGLALAGQGLQDTTRLATSPASIWRPAAASNADEIGIALDTLIALLARLRADLERGEILQQVFESARRWKTMLNVQRS